MLRNFTLGVLCYAVYVYYRVGCFLHSEDVSITKYQCDSTQTVFAVHTDLDMSTMRFFCECTKDTFGYCNTVPRKRKDVTFSQLKYFSKPVKLYTPDTSEIIFSSDSVLVPDVYDYVVVGPPDTKVFNYFPWVHALLLILITIIYFCIVLLSVIF